MGNLCTEPYQSRTDALVDRERFMATYKDLWVGLQEARYKKLVLAEHQNIWNPLLSSFSVVALIIIGIYSPIRHFLFTTFLAGSGLLSHIYFGKYRKERIDQELFLVNNWHVDLLLAFEKFTTMHRVYNIEEYNPDKLNRFCTNYIRLMTEFQQEQKSFKIYSPSHLRMTYCAIFDDLSKRERVNVRDFLGDGLQ